MTPAGVMNKLAVELQDQDERLTKEYKQWRMLKDAIANVNAKDMETSAEDQITKRGEDMEEYTKRYDKLRNDKEEILIEVFAKDTG